MSVAALPSQQDYEAGMVITNNGLPATIERIFVFWEAVPSNQKLDTILLNGGTIWNTSDPDAPSDIPMEGGTWGNASRTVPGPGSSSEFVIQFQEPLSGTPEVHVVFNIGCQVVR